MDLYIYVDNLFLEVCISPINQGIKGLEVYRIEYR